MSALAGSAYPAFKFGEAGSGVKGEVIDFTDVQARDFKTKVPKTYNDGNPIMDVRVTLETKPGDKTSRVSLYVSSQRMKQAVRGAMAGVGASDLATGATLGVTRTEKSVDKPGSEPSWNYTATYELPFDPTA